MLLKLAILASDCVTKKLGPVAGSDVIQEDTNTAQRDFHKKHEPNWRICGVFSRHYPSDSIEITPPYNSEAKTANFNRKKSP